VQEAINNVVKHAHAERVEVEVVEAGGSIRLSVQDDGGGFDPSRTDGGFGLIGMQERVELVGGRLSIESGRGCGTVVRAELPATHEPVEG
jgi:signal transduction histidine kinase